NPLKYDVVIIDEMSMVDVGLFESLLRGIMPQCRLIMVGDSNQIPAIGAGNLLDDIVNSGYCQVVSLNKVFRQSENSGIIINAHRVVNGDYPIIDGKYEDVLFVEADRFSAAEIISSLASEELPKKYDVNPKSDIQVLTPQRKGYAGSDALNIKLRESLNPKGGNKQEAVVMGRLFRKGDRVMQIKNNYDIT
ncbi:MAG: AAA family ATPase, partial [Ruminococcaceae bacterium]|nr:AAA family ATPase [Oscillospiraceae bacterium]